MSTIRRFFHKEPELPDVVVQRLLRGIEKTHDCELGCEDVFSLIDQYAELVAKGEDADRLMPLIRQHLDYCRECDEDYEALLRILQGQME
jgi:hypothetical protein